MSKLPLTFACGPYDRMEALNYGLIDVEGIDLNFLEIQAPREIFDRMVGDLATVTERIGAVDGHEETGT